MYVSHSHQVQVLEDEFIIEVFHCLFHNQSVDCNKEKITRRRIVLLCILHPSLWSIRCRYCVLLSTCMAHIENKKIDTTKMFCKVLVWTNLAHITYILSLGLHSLNHISRWRFYTIFFGQKWWTRFILHYGVLVSYKSKVKVFEVNFWIVSVLDRILIWLSIYQNTRMSVGKECAMIFNQVPRFTSIFKSTCISDFFKNPDPFHIFSPFDIVWATPYCDEFLIWPYRNKQNMKYNVIIIFFQKIIT